MYGSPRSGGGGDTLGLHRRLLGPGWGTPRASLTARVGHTPGFTHSPRASLINYDRPLQVAEVRELDAREKGGQLRGHLLSHRQRETV